MVRNESKSIGSEFMFGDEGTTAWSKYDESIQFDRLIAFCQHHFPTIRAIVGKYRQRLSLSGVADTVPRIPHPSPALLLPLTVRHVISSRKQNPNLAHPLQPRTQTVDSDGRKVAVTLYESYESPARPLEE
jgi:hypothetical protein